MLGSTRHLPGQNLADLNKSSIALDHSGSLNINSRYYHVNGIAPRSTNFWSISGRYTLSAAGFSFPVMLSLRKSGFNAGFSHPFNRFGASPYYKWVKLHIGHRNLNFSPYTLAGKTINGIGLELTPGNLRIAAIYGKMRNYQINNLPDDEVILLDLYTRKALGAKIGYGSAKNYFDIMFFKGVDEDNSALVDISYPNDNLVVGSKLHFTVLRRIVFETNFALSGFTENRNSFDVDLDPTWQPVESLVDVNASSRLNFAGDAQLQYRDRHLRLGLLYKRIDPLFKSIGTMYFQNDIEQYRVNFSTSLFKQKLSLQSNVGIEKNNISGKRALARDRFIFSGNASFTPNKNITSLFSYANYQQNSVPQFDLIEDTLRLTTTSQTIFLNTNFTHSEGELLRHGINLSIHRNTITDQSPVQNLGANILTTGVHLKYRLRHKLHRLMVSPGLRYSSYEIIDQHRTRYGLTMSVQKSWFENELSTTWSASYLYSDVNNLRNGTMWTTNVSANYKLMEKTTLNFRLYTTRRALVITPSFQEWRGSLGLGVRF